MRTILVPTDFSPAADVAVEYAVALANATGSAVLLLHTYQLPVTMNDLPVLMVPVEDLRATSENGLTRVKDEALKKYPAVAFQTESRMGDAVTEINLLAEERQTLCVVWGAQRLSGFENFLLGDDTLSMVRSSNYPVVVVHEGNRMVAPKNFLLAVDKEPLDEAAIETVGRFIETFGAKLHLVHITTEGEEAGEQPKQFAHLNADYAIITAGDVATGIAGHIREAAADMLIVLPHRHSFLERFFAKGHTGDIVDEARVPVLCIQA